MTQALTIPVLPESAPFTPSQRAWLNGFFAALIGSIPSAADGAPAVAAAEASAAPAAEETFPWHEPTLTMDERLKLAEGRPKARVLMAAMAQLDCGACGYDCMTYAEAIDRGEEKSLTKCAPGGGETAKKLKELVQLTITAIAPPTNTVATAVRIVSPVIAAPSARPRRNVRFAARLIANNRLNGPGSSKDTRHIVFSIKGSELTYEAGDALGVYPENCLLTAQQIIELLGASGAEEVPGRDEHDEVLSLIEALTRHYCIATPTPALLELLSKSARGGDAEALRRLAAEDEAQTLEELGVLDLLERYVSARPDPAQLVGTLAALRPRLYSIASSPRVHPDQVHLTVGVVRYTNSAGRACGGVASTCLAERVRLGERLRVFVQPTAHFRPPADPGTPAIMVGPGTGIAPFRAFLQDRSASAPGRSGDNWLFFGDQHEATDFLYRDELEGYRRDGALTRLDTAFSRDGTNKIYVQDRMRQHGAELWRWLERGAHFYICGDAKRMARDVDATLRQIITERGGMTCEAADAYVAEMIKARRYQRDVY